MRAPILLCLLFAACSNGPTESDAESLGGRPPADYQLRITGACPAGQFAKSIGADGTVVCATPDMSAADIVGVTTKSGSGLTGGAETGEVSLALAVCPAGQVLKNDGTGWACAADADLLATKTCTVGQVLHFDGTTWSCTADADSFAGRACPAGQLLKSNGTGWACAPDDDAPLPTCAQGQVLKSSGTGWLCASDDTMNSMSCPAGHVLKSNGAGYVCAPDDGIVAVTTPAGSGLTGGGSTGALSLALAPCADGQLLKVTDAGWACASDTVGLTAVSTAANGGLTGGATALSLTGCAAGEVLKSNGTGWACAPDTGLTAVTPRTGGGLVGNATSLSLASCASGEVLKATAAGDWVCAPDQNAGGDVTAIVTPSAGGIVGGTAAGDVTLSLRACALNEVLKFTATGWTCSADANAGGDITGITTASTSGLIGGTAAGDATLSLRTCAINEILKFTATGWSCSIDANAGGDLTGIITPSTGGLVGGATAGDSTLTLANCPAGQILKSTGTNSWSCQDDANAGGDLTGVVTPPTGGIVGGATSGDSTLTLANCTPGQVLKSTGINAWACAADSNAGGDVTGVLTPATGGLVGGAASGDATLSLAPCALDQVLRFDGTQWSCSAYAAPLVAGAGITIAGGAISATFATPGSEAGTGTTVARADHLHDARYQLLNVRTIVVRSTGTPAQNGAAMIAAVNSITNPSATNRWLIKLEPGEYDVGTAGFQGKSFVDLEGSGRNTTYVTGATNGPIINMPQVSEVRELLALHPGGTANATAIQLSTGALGAAAARRVTAVSSAGTGATHAVLITGTGLGRLEDSQMQVTVTAGSAYGVLSQANGQPIIRRCTFQVSGSGGTAYGINFPSGALILEDSKIAMSSTGLTIALLAGSNAYPQMTVNNLEVSVSGAPAPSRGIDFRGGTLSMRDTTVTTTLNVAAMITYDTTVSMRNIKLDSAGGAPALFIGHATVPGRRKITIDYSILDSNTSVPIAFAPYLATGGQEDVFIGVSRLDSTGGPIGPSTNSTLKCFGAYNENYDPLAVNCN